MIKFLQVKGRKANAASGLVFWVIFGRARSRCSQAISVLGFFHLCTLKPLKLLLHKLLGDPGGQGRNCRPGITSDLQILLVNGVFTLWWIHAQTQAHKKFTRLFWRLRNKMPSVWQRVFGKHTTWLTESKNTHNNLRREAQMTLLLNDASFTWLESEMNLAFRIKTLLVCLPRSLTYTHTHNFCSFLAVGFRISMSRVVEK